MLLLSFAGVARGQVSYEVLHAFVNLRGGASRLIQASDGNFYGTTWTGGAFAYGTAFKMDAAGVLTTLHSFSDSDGTVPADGLIQASDGEFYGTTSFGGASGVGTVFKMDAAGMVTVLHAFNRSDGATPHASLIQASDGNFYGTTMFGGAYDRGTVFKMDGTGAITTLHTFNGTDGAVPIASLIQASDGNFYGTTRAGGASDRGTVFKMDGTGAVTTLHTFNGTDGATPTAGLIQARDGTFYGTTAMGGSSDRGTVFKMDAAGVLTTLHSFSFPDGVIPYASVIQASDGNFYGTTNSGGGSGPGTVFRMDAAGVVTTLHAFSLSDGGGHSPYASLVQAKDGTFYGATHDGGPSGGGTIFKMDAAGVVTILQSFISSDGASPFAALAQANDGTFYGATRGGGLFGGGTIFKMDATRTVTTLHSFNHTDGADPYASLIQASDGTFYGATRIGGAAVGGTVFKMDAAGVVATLHSFNNADGGDPTGSLIQASDGNFYGTANSGGLFGGGTVFKMDAGGTITTLHAFSPSDGGGYSPFAGLIQARDGNIYGTTESGGPSDLGIVFKMDTAGTITTLHAFGWIDGAQPVAGLIQVTDGNFYGTTNSGGLFGGGTVFKMDAGGTITTLHAFSPSDGGGYSPFAGLIQARDGNIYGTTTGGGPFNYGTAFKMNPETGAVSTLHAFDWIDGARPFAGLIQAKDGNLYGTTTVGGARGGGVLFRLVMDSEPPDTLITGNPPVWSPNRTATFSFTATEAGSTFECQLDGSGFAACASSQTYSGLSEGSHTFQVRAKDGAGNLDPTPAGYTWTVDTTPPALTLPGTIRVDATSSAGAVVTYSASSTDNLDPRPAVSCTPPSGTIFPIGTSTVTCSATDAARNTTSQSFQVIVRGASDQIADLVTLVKSFNLRQGIENSLDAKLTNAGSALAAANGGDRATACNQLSAFINEVQAQSGKALTAAQANQLISAASRIKAVLGCP